MDLEDFEFYTYRGSSNIKYSFVYKKDTDNQLEGDIKFIKRNKKDIDNCLYIDYIELYEETSYGDKSDDFIEKLELYLEENVEEIFSRAEEI